MNNTCNSKNGGVEDINEALKKIDKTAFKRLIVLLKKGAKAFGKIGNMWLFKEVEATEEIADLWLKNNVLNRKTNQKMHRKLTNTMIAGGWIYDGACISSTPSGLSFDGQNRMLSFKAAKCPKGIISNFSIDGGIKDEDVRKIACARGSNIPYSKCQKTRERGFGVLSNDVSKCADAGMQFATWIADGSISDLPDSVVDDFQNLHRVRFTRACTTCHGNGSVFNPMIAGIVMAGAAYKMDEEAQQLITEIHKSLVGKSTRKEKLGFVISDAAADCVEWCNEYRRQYNSTKGQKGGDSAKKEFVAVGIKVAMAYFFGGSSGVEPEGSYLEECNKLTNLVVDAATKNNVKLFPDSMNGFIVRKSR